MSNVLTDYHPVLVILSYIVAVVGALVGLFASRYVRAEHGQIRVAWCALAALILAGCMMWAAHYVGMLAYQPDAPITFGLQKTWLSFVMALIFATVAVLIVTRHPDSTAVLVAGAATMTMGVVALHYGGVAALRVPAEIQHSARLVSISIVLAFATSTGALYVMSRAKGAGRYASVPLMGLAVWGTHFTGMASIRPGAPKESVEYFVGAVTPQVLTVFVAVAVAATVVIGLMLGLYGAFLRRKAEVSQGIGLE